MFRKNLIILAAICAAAVPAAAQADVLDGGSQHGVTSGGSGSGGGSYGDRNLGGPYGFYSYPSHRHVDGGNGGSLYRRPFSGLSTGTSPFCDNCHGSPYYGPSYGAPYFGGGYYDHGTYYRERRD